MKLIHLQKKNKQTQHRIIFAKSLKLSTYANNNSSLKQHHTKCSRTVKGKAPATGCVRPSPQTLRPWNWISNSLVTPIKPADCPPPLLDLPCRLAIHRPTFATYRIYTKCTGHALKRRAHFQLFTFKSLWRLRCFSVYIFKPWTFFNEKFRL